MRCSHCKAYMNPFMRWLEGGRRFQCNFCEGVSDCPGNYFSHIGGDGRRIDTDQRPELSRGQRGDGGDQGLHGEASRAGFSRGSRVSVAGDVRS